MRAVSHNPPAAFFRLSELPGNERNYFSPALHCQPLPPSRLSSYRHPATSFPAAIFFPLTYRVLSFFCSFFLSPLRLDLLKMGIWRVIAEAEGNVLRFNFPPFCLVLRVCFSLVLFGISLEDSATVSCQERTSWALRPRNKSIVKDWGMELRFLLVFFLLLCYAICEVA